MTVEGFTISSMQFWTSAAVTAAIDVLLILILIWRIKPAFFRELKWTLVGTAMVVWTGFTLLLLAAFWEDYYRYLFPNFYRAGALVLSVPFLYGFLAWGFHWLALRDPGNSIPIFCLLAGLESFLEHGWGFYGLKIMEIPMLQEASRISILAFAVPEYILYWCIMIGIAALIHSARGRLDAKQPKTIPA